MRYDYSMAGFDPFLSRSIDATMGQSGLGQNVPSASRAMAFDRQQTTGMLGDVFTVGNITINGAEGTITVSDGENVRVLIGFQQDGF